MAFVCITKIFTQNARRIREVYNVVTEEEIVLDDVPNDSSEKGDVAAGADWHPDIGQRTGA